VATYIVKKGDSLDKIAKAHHTTVDEIIKLNQLPSSFLRVGQQLKVPAERTLAAAPKPKPPAPAKEEGAAEYYTVKVGDNPWTIAMKHHMKVEDLLRLNALNEEKARKLKPGDRLRTR
jgi:LysM repeat protein